MGEFIRFSDAAERFGMSETTLRKRIREEKITVYINPRDKREKRLDVDELETKLGYRVDEGKAAA